MRFSSVHERQTGFTLIELLVVIAIVLILIAIALPNFLTAQVRAKVARARADMRTVRLVLENYFIDFDLYPDHATDTWHPSLLEVPSLTTPIEYLNSFPPDPFPRIDADIYSDPRSFGDGGYYRYYNAGRWKSIYPELEQQGIVWFLMSNGPDGDIDVHDNAGDIGRDLLAGKTYMYYAPTNGARSSGDFIKTNKDYVL